MNNLTPEIISAIIAEAERKQTQTEELLLFEIGVKNFYKDKPENTLYSAPYLEIGREAFKNLIPTIQSVLCNTNEVKDSVRRTIVLAELVAVLASATEYTTISSVLAIILNRGVEEICRLKN